MCDEDEEVEDKGPSSPKAGEVRVEAKEGMTVETSAKAPEEEEVPATVDPVLDEEDRNAKVELERRRSKQRQSLPKTLMGKPRQGRR
ncbi:hypothetical protein R1flu_000415 [Riccia fluitans]|uniref:Uncharacterized protein n=1 Tax=Riccia fluitans TaxID=41844 RepID=A0ABD1Y0V2_9MARC